MNETITVTSGPLQGGGTYCGGCHQIFRGTSAAHACGGLPTQYISSGWSAPTTLERIAEALERIAAALERQR